MGVQPAIRGHAGSERDRNAGFDRAFAARGGAKRCAEGVLPNCVGGGIGRYARGLDGDIRAGAMALGFRMARGAALRLERPGGHIALLKPVRSRSRLRYADRLHFVCSNRLQGKLVALPGLEPATSAVTVNRQLVTYSNQGARMAPSIWTTTSTSSPFDSTAAPPNLAANCSTG